MLASQAPVAPKKCTLALWVTSFVESLVNAKLIPVKGRRNPEQEVGLESLDWHNRLWKDIFVVRPTMQACI